MKGFFSTMAKQVLEGIRCSGKGELGEQLELPLVWDDPATLEATQEAA